MTNKELRKMSRAELLEMLIEQMEENQRLETELEQARSELENRRVAVAQSGTMAEAALRLNGVFEAADRAVKQYLENVCRPAGEGEDESQVHPWMDEELTALLELDTD